MEPWRSAITNVDGERIAVRGHDLVTMMRGSTFADMVGLLLGGRLPDAGERRLLESILIAIADHGAGSPSAAAARVVATGNRQAPEAAIAAGILAVGDAHAGAGYACMTVLAAGVSRMDHESIPAAAVAAAIVADARSASRRLPGFGHRLYQEDPRTTALFELAAEAGKAGRAVELVMAIHAELARTVKPLAINVDGAIAAVLCDLGYPPVTAKLIFIVGRSAGLAAQVMEEYTRERPMRVRIPVVYDGPAAV
jgi:citrate synthase